MNNKTVRKIKQTVRRNAKESFDEVVEAIESLSFFKRFAVCMKILAKRL